MFLINILPNACYVSEIMLVVFTYVISFHHKPLYLIYISHTHTHKKKKIKEKEKEKKNEAQATSKKHSRGLKFQHSDSRLNMLRLRSDHLYGLKESKTKQNNNSKNSD